MEGRRVRRVRRGWAAHSVALLVALVAFGVTPARGQEGPDGNAGGILTPGDGGVDVWVGTPGESSDGTGSGGGSSNRTCHLELDADVTGAPKWPIEAPDGAVFYWFWIVCDGQRDGAPVLLRVDPAARRPPAAVLAEEASRFLSLPAPEVHVNPPGGAVVHLPTWLWVSPATWRDQRVTVAVTGLAVTARAVPTTVTWRFGSLPPLTCTGPGTAYDTERQAEEQHSACTYTFRRDSAAQPGGVYQAAATTSWRVTWQGSDGTAGALAPLPRSTTFRLPVGEVHTVVTASEGHRR